MAMSIMLTTPNPTTTATSAFPLHISSLRRARRVSTSIRSSAEGGDAGPRLDRRNVLLGLGGLYGATTVGGAARGDPLQPPDLNSCHVASYPDGYNDLLPVQCCPPYDLSKPLDIQPYVIPKGGPVRTRKAAHNMTQWEQDRFKRAIAEMKKLPSNHPWNFMQQAQIHCAYCDDAYDQKGYKVPLQVHFSWIFCPWHRWYLYFFEKILGKIIGDDTFFIPYWAYDVEEGMKVSEMYKDTSSSLYNPNRNMSHKDQPMYLNYTYDLEDTPLSPTLVQDNLTIMANLYDDDSLGTPELFMGDKFAAGELVNGSIGRSSSGRLEWVHNFVHMWVGQVSPPNMDMGIFVSAARDMLFYAHHTNVDRLWHLYQAKRNNKVEFDDTNWLDSTFVFYDENQKIVSVKVRDCLNTADMGYVYEDIPIKYMTLPKGNPKSPPAGSGSPGDFGTSPRPLTSTIVATVKRPKASRSAAEKAKEAEVLIVDGIEVTKPDAAAFDVYVSNLSQSKSELVGTYSRIRHSHVHSDGSLRKMSYKAGITGVVERIGAEGDDKVVVTLVPRTGTVNVGGARIELAPKH